MKTTLISLAAAALVGQAAATYSYGPDSNPACSELEIGNNDAYDICDTNTGQCVNIMSFNLFFHINDNPWKEPQNCGACGRTCPGDDSVCSMGECCPHSTPLWCPIDKRCHKAIPDSARIRMARNLSSRMANTGPIYLFDPTDDCVCPPGFVSDPDAPYTCRSCAEENAMWVDGPGGPKCEECRGGAIASEDGLHCLCPPGLGYQPHEHDVVLVPRGYDHTACKECPEDSIANENSECEKCEYPFVPNEWATECICPRGWVPNGHTCEQCTGNKIAYNGNCMECPENTTPNSFFDQCVCAPGYAWIKEECTKCTDVGANYDHESRGCKCPDKAKFDEDYQCHCRKGMEMVEGMEQDWVVLTCQDCAHDLVSEDGLTCHQCPVPLTANRRGSECICDIKGAMFVNGECKCPENMQEIFTRRFPGDWEEYFRGKCVCDDNAVPSEHYESGCKVCKDLDTPRVPNQDQTSCVKCSINKIPNDEGTKCVCKPGYTENAEYGCDKEDGYEEPNTCDGADLQTDANNCGECGNVCEATDKPADVKDRWWWRWWGAVGQYRPQKKGECEAGKCI